MTTETRRNPRRQVLHLLENPMKRLKWIKNQWTVSSMVFVPAVDRKPGENVVSRKREPGEYPENDANQWAMTVNQIDVMVYELTTLRDFAVEQMRERS